MRLIVAVITFVAWAALAIVIQVLVTTPAITLVPLVVLAGGFEVVFAAHVGVERIGRYLLVHYEAGESGVPRWEHAITEIGPRAGAGSGIDPLFSVVFILAALLNLVPLAFATVDLEPTLPGGLSYAFALFAMGHALFIARVLRARRFAASQRQRDTELFQQIATLRPKPSNPLV